MPEAYRHSDAATVYCGAAYRGGHLMRMVMAGNGLFSFSSRPYADDGHFSTAVPEINARQWLVQMKLSYPGFGSRTEAAFTSILRQGVMQCRSRAWRPKPIGEMPSFQGSISATMTPHTWLFARL